ncbi:hypothetical protein B4166_0995 [Caldibacillus thermoamylovorans]|uniref:Uncharacterized protein n=1 Tax=Caldibacillus thermoamylovorans TaxID=35841 RepID=A0ABD4A250_9BACI|nr:hypothetical protein B4166_0995 [Caldibacillus thermoamylovorans]KIO70339.1 hypothetical protein B4167_1031 [Caldibacillus thermoamylovorans]
MKIIKNLSFNNIFCRRVKQYRRKKKKQKQGKREDETIFIYY